MQESSVAISASNVAHIRPSKTRGSIISPDNTSILRSKLYRHEKDHLHNSNTLLTDRMSAYF